MTRFQNNVKARSAKQERAQLMVQMSAQIAVLKVEYAKFLRCDEAERAADVHEKIIETFDAMHALDREQLFDDLDMIARNATVNATAIAAQLLSMCRLEPDDSGGFRAVRNEGW